MYADGNFGIEPCMQTAISRFPPRDGADSPSKPLICVAGASPPDGMDEDMTVQS